MPIYEDNFIFYLDAALSIIAETDFNYELYIISLQVAICLKYFAGQHESYSVNLLCP